MEDIFFVFSPFQIGGEKKRTMMIHVICIDMHIYNETRTKECEVLLRLIFFLSLLLVPLWCVLVCTMRVVSKDIDLVEGLWRYMFSSFD